MERSSRFTRNLLTITSYVTAVKRSLLKIVHRNTRPDPNGGIHSAKPFALPRV